jgi:site-specific recombinase XerD
MIALTARDLWLEELRIRSCSPATLAAYTHHTEQAMGSIAGFLGVPVHELMLEEVTRDSVVAALSKYRSRPDGRTKKEAQRSASSVERHLAALKSLLNWCVMTEKLTRNVAAQVKAPRAGQRIPKALSVEACGELLKAAASSQQAQRDTLLLLCGLALGLRLAEITSLTLESFSPSVVAPTHVTVVGKGAKERSVPVPGAVRNALGTYLVVRSQKLLDMGATSNALFLSSRPYDRAGVAHVAATRDGLGQAFNRMLERAQLKRPGLRAHMARHSFAAIALASDTFNLEELRTLLGHSSIATTQHYLKVDPARLSAGSESHPLAHLGAR